MKNMFIGLLILMTMAATSNAAIIRSAITVTASDEYVTIMDPFTFADVDGRAENVITDWKFDERTGFHQAYGAITANDSSGTSWPTVDDLDEGVMWIASVDPLPSITFDLEYAQTVAEIKVWNANSTYLQYLDGEGPENLDRSGMSVKEMQIVLEDDTNQVLATLGPYTLTKGPGRDDVDFGQVIDIPDTSNVRYVRFNVLSNYGDAPFNQVGLSQVLFYDDIAAPTVDAGPDQRVWLEDFGAPGSDPNDSVVISLDGTITGGSAPTQWSVYEYMQDTENPPYSEFPYNDPNFDPSIVDASAVDTTVVIKRPGTYIFTFTSGDPDPYVFDRCRVKVLAVDDTGLLNHWAFDEGSGDTAHDSVLTDGSSDLAVDTNLLSWSPDTPTGSGSAIEFGNGYLKMSPRLLTYHAPIYEFTASLWFKVTNPAEYIECLLDMGSFRLYQMGERLAFLMSDSYYEPFWTGETQTDINDGQWHHVALTHDGFRANLYIDSRLAGGVTLFDTMFPPRYFELYIGAINFPGRQPYKFNGLMDDIKLYQICLTQDEIVAEYQSAGYEPCNSIDLIHSDMNGDCQVDLADLALMVGNWL